MPIPAESKKRSIPSRKRSAVRARTGRKNASPGALEPFAARRVCLERCSRLTPRLLWAHHGDIPEWALEIQFDGLRQSIDVWYLETGSLTLQYERETERYEAPCWVFPKHYPIQQKLSPGGKRLGIRFSLNWADDSPLLALDRTVQFPRGRYRRFDRISEELVRFVGKEIGGKHVFLEERPASLASVAGFFSQFWRWIESYIAVLEDMKLPLVPRSTLDPRVVAAIDYLRRLPLSGSLREKVLAAECSVSVAQLNRLFKQQVGFSPVQIRNIQRMRAACQALLYSTETIKPLAYSLGFHSPQHFAMWFRKRAGTGPRNFRRTH